MKPNAQILDALKTHASTFCCSAHLVTWAVHLSARLFAETMFPMDCLLCGSDELGGSSAMLIPCKRDQPQYRSIDGWPLGLAYSLCANCTAPTTADANFSLALGVLEYQERESNFYIH